MEGNFKPQQESCLIKKTQIKIFGHVTNSSLTKGLGYQFFENQVLYMEQKRHVLSMSEIK